MGGTLRLIISSVDATGMERIDYGLCAEILLRADAHEKIFALAVESGSIGERASVNLSEIRVRSVENCTAERSYVREFVKICKGYVKGLLAAP